MISYALFLTAAMESILGFLLLRNNPRKSNVLWTVTALSFFSAAFSFTSAMMYLRTSLGMQIDLFARFNWIGWFTVPAALQLLYYLKDEHSRGARTIGYILYPFWVIMLGLCIFTDLIVAPGYSVHPFINAHGQLDPFARLFGSLLVVWLLYETVRLRREFRGHQRQQLNYFFQGVLIFGGGAAFTAGFLQLVGGFGFEPGLASLFSLPWVALTYYAITRHRLFDIRIVITRALTTALLLLLLFPLQFLLFNFLRSDFGEPLSILVSLGSVGLVFFGTRLNRTTQRWVQRLVLQDRYNYQQVLQESILAINTILDLNELLDFIIGSMKKSLMVDNVCLSLHTKGGWTFRQESPDFRADQASQCSVDEAVLDWLWKVGRIVVREELNSLLTNASNDERRVLDLFARTNSELIVPLLYKGDLKGFIMLGQKGTGRPYVQSDIDLLALLASHAAVAIENARLYEEVSRAKDSLRESEEKFRSLAETAPAIIFIHQGGTFLYANNASISMLGYTREEFMAMDFWGVTHPDDKEMIIQRGRSRIKGEEVPQRYELRVVTKSGDVRWLDMTVGKIVYEGKPAVIGNAFDITDRKQAEEERERLYEQLRLALQSLKESESRFRTLAETTSAGIVIYRAGQLIYVNPAGEKLTGHNREKLIGMPLIEIIHPNYRDLVTARGEARLLGLDVPREYEFMMVTRLGEERWISMTAGVIEYEGEPAVIATLFDITDRKRAEMEMVHQYEQRIAVEKRHVLEKEKILMDLHDGIGGITTNVSILSELAQKADNIASIKNTLATISRLSREGISEIRSFMHSLDTTEMNWRTLATELKSQGTNLVEPHGIAFSLEAGISDDTPEQPGSMLWVNLFKIYKEALTNVIKHSKAKAVVIILSVTRESIQLSIQDDGIGMKKKIVGGRGLSNMRKRAQELGGTVEMSSVEGTQVHLVIPIPIKYPLQGMDI